MELLIFLYGGCITISINMRNLKVRSATYFLWNIIHCKFKGVFFTLIWSCLLYTSDAADER